jgi:hypothetical protein
MQVGQGALYWWFVIVCPLGYSSLLCVGFDHRQIVLNKPVFVGVKSRNLQQWSRYKKDK